VPITEDELESLEAEANRSIDLKEFILLASVDPVYFENTHYLGADKAARSRIAFWLMPWPRAAVLPLPSS